MSEFIMPSREQDSNKGTFGKVLNFSGSGNYIGAAYLSTLGALKSGAGYVALASEKKVLNSVSILLPEAVLLSRTEGLKSLDKYTVCLIGCGLGQKRNSVNLFKKVIEGKRKNIDTPLSPLTSGEINSFVIDADGLNILSSLSKINLPQNTILTPHPLEASRLLGVEVNEVLQDLEGSAKKLSKKYNCVVALKTHRTVVCERDRIYVNQHGNSALAKAGTGDVLAGIISGLLAQKMTPFESAKLAVYLHSRAGELASEDLTEYSPLASDILNYLPNAIKEIL